MSDRPNEIRTDIAVVEGGRVATLTFDNRSRLNTLNPALINDATTAITALHNDEELRALVLTGEGDRAFVGGADINHMAGLDSSSGRAFISSIQQLHQAILDVPVPVVGRINGYTLGAGMELAACCDYRICADNAEFGMPEVHVGIPSVIEAHRLPMLIGWGRTRELLLTGRWIKADEALRIGMVEQVVSQDALDSAVNDSLSLLVRAAPKAVRDQKALMNQWESLSQRDGLKASIDAFAGAYETDEPQRYMQAFINRKRDQ